MGRGGEPICLLPLFFLSNFFRLVFSFMLTPLNVGVIFLTSMDSVDFKCFGFFAISFGILICSVGLFFFWSTKVTALYIFVVSFFVKIVLMMGFLCESFLADLALIVLSDCLDSLESSDLSFDVSAFLGVRADGK